MPRRNRQDCAQLSLRLEPAERDRIRRAIPHGSLNAVAIQLLLLGYTQMISQPTFLKRRALRRQGRYLVRVARGGYRRKP